MAARSRRLLFVSHTQLSNCSNCSCVRSKILFYSGSSSSFDSRRSCLRSIPIHAWQCYHPSWNRSSSLTTNTLVRYIRSLSLGPQSLDIHFTTFTFCNYYYSTTNLSFFFFFSSTVCSLYFEKIKRPCVFIFFLIDRWEGTRSIAFFQTVLKDEFPVCTYEAKDSFLLWENDKIIKIDTMTMFIILYVLSDCIKMNRVEPLVWDSGNFLFLYDENIFTRIVLHIYRKISVFVYYSIMDSRVVKNKTLSNNNLHHHEEYTFLMKFDFAGDKSRDKKKGGERKKNGIFLVDNMRFRKRESHRHSKKEAKYFFLHHLIMNTCKRTECAFTGKWYIIYCT